MMEPDDVACLLFIKKKGSVVVLHNGQTPRIRRVAARRSCNMPTPKRTMSRQRVSGDKRREFAACKRDRVPRKLGHP